MLRVRNLEAGYGVLKVLKNISLHVNPGEIVTLIGANGAGKTTLLHTLAGINKPFSGMVSFIDTEIIGKRPEQIVAAGCSLVPEGRQLFADMTVEDNLVLGGYPHLNKKKNELFAAQLKHTYTLFPRLKERAQQLAGTLSGGEQQMLAIGRALMTKPKLLMLDEPSTGLAPLIVKDILATIVTLREEGTTILLVEQNARAALKIADRGYVLETGTLLIEGDAEELLHNHDVRRAYLGKDYRSIDEQG
jgi:branched-chain amino acid transport system ATP-binding protein